MRKPKKNRLDPSLFLRGFVIGLAIAAPVGPIGLLCIRQSVAGGFPLGFMTGLGAAAADAVYGAVAAFGLTAIASFLIEQQAWLRLVGGIVLIALGLRIALKPAANQQAAVARRESAASGLTPFAPLVGAFAQTFLLTLANPATILSFVAVFAGLGLGAVGGSVSGAASIVSGVFLGSAAWWLFLAGATSALGRQVPPAVMRWINRASGGLIAAFGLAALVTLIF